MVFGFRLIALAGLLAAWSSMANAAEGETSMLTYTSIGAATIQVIIAITVGLGQSGYARSVRLNDERIAMLQKRADEHAKLLAETREAYARRTDLQEAVASVTAQVSDLRGEVRELRTEMRDIRSGIDKLTSLLDVPR